MTQEETGAPNRHKTQGLQQRKAQYTAQRKQTWHSGCALHVLVAGNIKYKHSSAANRYAHHVRCKLAFGAHL